MTVKALLRLPMWGSLVLGACAVIALAGCNSYGHRQFQPVLTSGDWFDVEVDDFGQLWAPEQQQAALDVISSSAATQNTVVVVFAHGWHHNASTQENGNRAQFMEAMQAVRAKLQSEPYRAAREHLGVGADLRVIGLYVGWRGRSLPGPLDYATFWGRKAAAERVGEGAVRELALRLNEIYKRSNSSNSKHFMGLVLLGHSFGGQVMHRATASVFEDDLVRRESTLEALLKSGGAAALTEPPAPGVSGILCLRRVYEVTSRSW